MKRELMVCLSLFACAVFQAFAGLEQPDFNADPRPWTIENFDCNFYPNTQPDEKMNAESAAKFTDGFLQGPVTHLFVNAAGYPSRVAEAAWEGRLWCTDDPMKDHWRRRMKLMYDNGFDLFQFWIRYAQKRGVEGWVSMRMNDTHGYQFTDGLNPVFWHEHREYWRVPNAQDTTWPSRALDFAHKPVRDRAIAMADELFARYPDMDGFDADWTRCAWHLTPGRERELSGCLTEVMREIRRKADDLSVRRGRRVSISATVLSMPDLALGSGCDVVTWAKEGFVDVVLVANYYFCANFATPYRKWRELLGKVNPKVRVVPRADDFAGTFPCWRGGPSDYLDITLYRGFCDNMMVQGCHDFAAFNLFDVSKPKARMILKEGIRKESVYSGTRRYPVVYLDAGPAGYDPKLSVPCPLNGTNSVRIAVGTASDAESVFVNAGFDRAGIPALPLTLNGVACVTSETNDVPWVVDGHFARSGTRCAFPAAALRAGINEIRFPVMEDVKVLRCTIEVEPTEK